MPSIRITQFAGLMPELSAKLKRKDNAQIAHNCLLYDGRLQAMPAYFNYDTLALAPKSMIRTSNGGMGRVIPDYDLSSAVFFENPPFPNATVGITNRTPLEPYVTNNFVGLKFGFAGVGGIPIGAGVEAPQLTTPATCTVVNQGFLTPRPACVSYALTSIRGNGFTIEESAPTFLGTVGGADGQLWHEGDAVTIAATLATFKTGQFAYRLYRTITAIESGEQLVNTFDTDWYLVDELPVTGTTFQYTDVVLTQNLPGDLLLTKQFYCPYFKNPPNFVGVTESGWLWHATPNEIQFSERYMPHAWPIANYMQLQSVDQIYGATTFYDTVFVGTSGRPYRATVKTSDDDMVEVNAYPYPEHQPTIPGTMVTAPFGALYTSANGVVSLTDEKMSVITRDLLNGGDVLYKHCDYTFRFQDIQSAAWFNGWYIGYSATGVAFVYQAPEDLNDVHAFQQLVTMDTPQKLAGGPWALGDYGLQIAFGNELYYWPVPGWVRAGDTPTKLCYTWKSKKFVFPGSTAFAAAKVVFDCKAGEKVCIKLIGDCRVLFERTVCNCQPFRLPPSRTHIEYEIVITGTATVSEVHFASSMQDLTEVENE